MHKGCAPRMQTRTGGRFWLDADRLRENTVDPQDVAWGLAHIGRFTGHASRFYSVAEHTCRMVTYVEMLAESHLVPPSVEVLDLVGAVLLHDAHEAYLGDLSRPLKSAVPAVVELEARVEALVRSRLGGGAITDHAWALCSKIDNLFLAAEATTLMGGPEAVEEWEFGALLDGVPMPVVPDAIVVGPRAWAARWRSVYTEWVDAMDEAGGGA